MRPIPNHNGSILSHNVPKLRETYKYMLAKPETAEEHKNIYFQQLPSIKSLIFSLSHRYKFVVLNYYHYLLYHWFNIYCWWVFSLEWLWVRSKGRSISRFLFLNRNQEVCKSSHLSRKWTCNLLKRDSGKPKVVILR